MNDSRDPSDDAPDGARRIPIRGDDEETDFEQPVDPESFEELEEEGPEAADDDASSVADPPTAEELEELRRKAAERDEMQRRLKRVAADFANAQKRIEREARTRIDYAIQDFLRELLAVTDSLERALNAAEQSKDIDSFIEGIKLVDKQFHDILARHHVEPVPAVKGEPFDPEHHEVMAVLPTDEYPEHSVIEEVERGFRLKNRLVRPAKVIVAGAPPEAPSET